MRPLDFMAKATRGYPYNRRDVWLWWPVRVKWVPRGWNGKPRFLRGFTQHGWELRCELEPIGQAAPGVGIMVVRTVRYVVRCWNVGPLCITFGKTAEKKRNVSEPGDATGEKA